MYQRAPLVLCGAHPAIVGSDAQALIVNALWQLPTSYHLAIYMFVHIDGYVGAFSVSIQQNSELRQALLNIQLLLWSSSVAM